MGVERGIRWVDQPGYVGPDRRQREGLRFIERRHEDLAGPLPPLATALRQMRQHVLDAHGEGLEEFAMRAKGVAALARLHGRPETSAWLMRIAAIAPLGARKDIRGDLLELLDSAQRALH